MDYKIDLTDGRHIGVATYGDEKGTPLFFFHGIPGSRLQRHPDNSLLCALGVRLIVVERPGYGLSTFKQERKLTDWPLDVAQVANVLGIERFAVFGVSGGGPYATACACNLHDRITAAFIVSSLTDMSVSSLHMKQPLGILFMAASVAPWMLHGALSILNPLVHAGHEHLYDSIILALPEADKEVLKRPDIKAMMLDDMAAALSSGASGMAYDIELLAGPWGIDLSKIKMPVYLWHGYNDTIVPVEMGRHLALRIPGCKATFINDAGHFMVFNHLQDILKPLTII